MTRGRTLLLVALLCLVFTTLVNAASRDQYKALLPAVSRTASLNVDFAFDTTKYRGMILVFDCSARSGTNPTLDIKLQFKDPISGNFVDMTGASFAQKTATGTDTLTVYPTLAETANRRVSGFPAPDMRLVTAIGGTATPTFNYSVSMIYLP